MFRDSSSRAVDPVPSTFLKPFALVRFVAVSWLIRGSFAGLLLRNLG